MGATSTASGRLEVNLFLPEAGWKEPLWYNPSFSCMWIWRFCPASRSLLPTSMQTNQYPREPVLLRANHAACSVVSISNHVSYLRVLASRKDMQGTLALPQTCLITISSVHSAIAWAVASFSRGEGGDVKHTFMGMFNQWPAALKTAAVRSALQLGRVTHLQASKCLIGLVAGFFQASAQTLSCSLRHI